MMAFPNSCPFKMLCMCIYTHICMASQEACTPQHFCSTRVLFKNFSKEIAFHMYLNIVFYVTEYRVLQLRKTHTYTRPSRSHLAPHDSILWDIQNRHYCK